MKEITGWHVFGLLALGFGMIIAVNLTLAWNAVATFPGLEVKNSYVASQSFENNRAAQTALEWDVTARLVGNNLVLTITHKGDPIEPKIESAVFGRATTVAADQTPAFIFNGTSFIAPVTAGPGNWNLRFVARAADNTRFRQRIIVETNT